MFATQKVLRSEALVTSRKQVRLRVHQSGKYGTRKKVRTGAMLPRYL